MVGIAILVESFGFSSGVIGYIRRGLIDSKTAFTFALASMPAALIASKYLSLPELSLKTVYSLLMIGLSLYLLQQSGIVEGADDEEPPGGEIVLSGGNKTIKQIISIDAT